MLRRSRLLDVGANCQGLAGLYNMLYEREPSNNLINWLLLSGVLHQWLGEDTPNLTELHPLDARSVTETQVGSYISLIGNTNSC